MAHIREELGLHSSRLTEFVIRGSEICIEAGAVEDDRGLVGQQLHQIQIVRGEERCFPADHDEHAHVAAANNDRRGQRGMSVLCRELPTAARVNAKSELIE